MFSRTLIVFPRQELNGSHKLGPFVFQHYEEAGMVYYQGLVQVEPTTMWVEEGLDFDTVVELGVLEEVQVV